MAVTLWANFVLSEVSTAAARDPLKSLQTASSRTRVSLERRVSYAYPDQLANLPWDTDSEARSSYCFPSAYPCRFILDEDRAIGARLRHYLAPGANGKIVLPPGPVYATLPHRRVNGVDLVQGLEDVCSPNGFTRLEPAGGDDSGSSSDSGGGETFLQFSYAPLPTCAAGVIERIVTAAVAGFKPQPPINGQAFQRLKHRDGRTAIVDQRNGNFRIVIADKLIVRTANQDNPPPPVFRIPVGRTYAQVTMFEIRTSTFDPFRMRPGGTQATADFFGPNTDDEWLSDVFSILVTQQGLK